MAIELRDIRKSYGKKEVLRGVSLTVEKGETAALLGLNGSGKSTLLRVLAGILKSDGGRFLRDGTDLLRDRRALEKAVGYVPQGTPLVAELSALDNLRLWYDREKLEASLRRGMLRELGVGDFLRTPVHRLSGGMKKRLSIGCAIAGDPEMLLLDEPGAALDMAAQERLRAYYAAFCAAGGTILIATHDPRELEPCAKSWLLRGGVAVPYVYDGDTAKLTRELEA